MSESEYIDIYEDPRAKLDQVRTLLDAFDQLALDLVKDGMVKGYTLNDGQVNISTTYGSMRELNSSRLAYEQLANRLLAQINGRASKFYPC